MLLGMRLADGPVNTYKTLSLHTSLFTPTALRIIARGCVGAMDVASAGLIPADATPGLLGTMDIVLFRMFRMSLCPGLLGVMVIWAWFCQGSGGKSLATLGYVT